MSLSKWHGEFGSTIENLPALELNVGGVWSQFLAGGGSLSMVFRSRIC